MSSARSTGSWSSSRRPKLTGEIAPILKGLVDRELIRVLDLMFLTKDLDGGLEVFESSDLEDSEIGELRAYETELAMLLSEQDVLDLAETIEPGQFGGGPGRGRTCGPRRSVLRFATPAGSWPPAGASRSRR